MVFRREVEEDACGWGRKKKRERREKSERIERGAEGRK